MRALGNLFKSSSDIFQSEEKALVDRFVKDRTINPQEKDNFFKKLVKEMSQKDGSFLWKKEESQGDLISWRDPAPGDVIYTEGPIETYETIVTWTQVIDRYQHPETGDTLLTVVAKSRMALTEKELTALRDYHFALDTKRKDHHHTHRAAFLAACYHPQLNKLLSDQLRFDSGIAGAERAMRVFNRFFSKTDFLYFSAAFFGDFLEVFSLYLEATNGAAEAKAEFNHQPLLEKAIEHAVKLASEYQTKLTKDINDRTFDIRILGFLCNQGKQDFVYGVQLYQELTLRLKQPEDAKQQKLKTLREHQYIFMLNYFRSKNNTDVKYNEAKNLFHSEMVKGSINAVLFLEKVLQLDGSAKNPLINFYQQRIELLKHKYVNAAETIVKINNRQDAAWVEKATDKMMLPALKKLKDEAIQGLQQIEKEIETAALTSAEKVELRASIAKVYQLWAGMKYDEPIAEEWVNKAVELKSNNAGTAAAESKHEQPADTAAIAVLTSPTADVVVAGPLHPRVDKSGGAAADATEHVATP